MIRASPLGHLVHGRRVRAPLGPSTPVQGSRPPARLRLDAEPTALGWKRQGSPASGEALPNWGHGHPGEVRRCAEPISDARCLLPLGGDRRGDRVRASQPCTNGSWPSPIPLAAGWRAIGACRLGAVGRIPRSRYRRRTRFAISRAVVDDSHLKRQNSGLHDRLPRPIVTGRRSPGNSVDCGGANPGGISGGSMLTSIRLIPSMWRGKALVIGTGVGRSQSGRIRTSATAIIDRAAGFRVASNASKRRPGSGVAVSLLRRQGRQTQALDAGTEERLRRRQQG